MWIKQDSNHDLFMQEELEKDAYRDIENEEEEEDE